ncbi:hypothetical protein BC628DRAFT_318865 [Trametes gibbosa]|nr:hypothetical protein BC628DRAFT_318865 [Trametes gibbosa]
MSRGRGARSTYPIRAALLHGMRQEDVLQRGPGALASVLAARSCACLSWASVMERSGTHVLESCQSKRSHRLSSACPHGLETGIHVVEDVPEVCVVPVDVYHQGREAREHMRDEVKGFEFFGVGLEIYLQMGELGHCAVAQKAQCLRCCQYGTLPLSLLHNTSQRRNVGILLQGRVLR